MGPSEGKIVAIDTVSQNSTKLKKKSFFWTKILGLGEPYPTTS